MASDIKITELNGSAKIVGCGVAEYRNFEVQRPGRDAHRVRIEVSHDGAPQNEHCDCKGFRFSKSQTCSHVKAVLYSGLIMIDSDM